MRLEDPHTVRSQTLVTLQASDLQLMQQHIHTLTLVEHTCAHTCTKTHVRNIMEFCAQASLLKTPRDASLCLPHCFRPLCRGLPHHWMGRMQDRAAGKLCCLPEGSSDDLLVLPRQCIKAAHDKHL